MNWTYMRHLKLKHVQFTSCVQGGAKSDRMTEVVIKKFLQGSIQNKVKFFEDIDNIFFSIKFSFRSEFLTFSFRFGTGLSFHISWLFSNISWTVFDFWRQAIVLGYLLLVVQKITKISRYYDYGCIFMYGCFWSAVNIWHVLKFI